MQIRAEWVKNDITSCGVSGFYTAEGKWTIYEIGPKRNKIQYNAVLSSNEKTKFAISGSLDQILERINRGE